MSRPHVPSQHAVAAERRSSNDIKAKHEQIVAGFNEVLKKPKPADRVKIDGLTLADIGMARTTGINAACPAIPVAKAAGNTVVTMARPPRS